MTAHISGANMRAPTQPALLSPSLSRPTTFDISAQELTDLPHTLSVVVGRASSTPATVGDMDERTVVTLVDVDYIEIAKNGSTRSISLNHNVGAIAGPVTVGNKLWVSLVHGDPTDGTTTLDLVSGPFVVVA